MRWASVRDATAHVLDDSVVQSRCPGERRSPPRIPPPDDRLISIIGFTRTVLASVSIDLSCRRYRASPRPTTRKADAAVRSPRSEWWPPSDRRRIYGECATLGSRRARTHWKPSSRFRLESRLFATASRVQQMHRWCDGPDETLKKRGLKHFLA